jgi:hypothetical protein
MEKRRHERKTCGREVSYASPAAPYRGSIDNISAGGMLIRTVDPVAPGVELTLDFTLSGKRIRVRGEVVRLANRSLGVEFLPGEKGRLAPLVSTIP